MPHFTACPFCGSTKLKPIQADDDMWFIECPSCRCTGPVRHGEVQAIVAWTSRAELPGPEDGERHTASLRGPNAIH
jgi:hypothetical protein